MSAFLIAGFYGAFQVTQVVQTVKNSDNVNTVCDGFLYEVLNHIISIMTISKNILSS